MSYTSWKGCAHPRAFLFLLIVVLFLLLTIPARGQVVMTEKGKEFEPKVLHVPYAFYNQSALQSVRFHGPAPTLESLNNLVKYVPSRGSSDAKQTTIYASKHQEGWRSDTILDAVTEEERALWIAANPLENPSNLRGVLKRDASQASKAWIVHAGSPFDKKVNTLLLVR